MNSVKYKILLVEDDQLDQKAFERVVDEKQLPYDYTIADSVTKAKDVLQRESFDVIISDYALGDGTGFDLLALVKDIPFVLVTGTGDEELAVKAWKEGASDYLIKDLQRNYLKTVPVTIDNAIKHKQIGEKLHLLSSAMMSTQDSVCITDMDDKIIFVNKAFCKTYGYHEKDVLGKDSNILWMPHSNYTRSVFQIVGSAWEVGFYHKRKDGSVFPVSLSRSIVKDSKGRDIAIVGVVRDISERILFEESLQNDNIQVKEQNRLQRELAVAFSNKLINVIVEVKALMIRIVEVSSQHQISDVSDLTAKLKNKLDRLNNIVLDYYDTAQISSEKMKIEFSELSLRSVVREILKALAPLAADKQIDFDASMPSSSPELDTDWNRILRVLKSLISDIQAQADIAEKRLSSQ